MYSVLFEVKPRPDRWDAYLDYAAMLRPELEQIPGFVDNIRYASLRRDGWILSLSSWDSERALVRWRTRARHHEVQANGRDHVFDDYHLRVALVLSDNRLPAGHKLSVDAHVEPTQVGPSSVISLIAATQPVDWVRQATGREVANRLGVDPEDPEILSWEVFDAVLNPGDVIALVARRDEDSAETAHKSLSGRDDLRVRDLRVMRDYGMHDRRENPQFFPDVAPRGRRPAAWR